MQVYISKSADGHALLSCDGGGGESYVDVSLIPEGLAKEDQMSTLALHAISRMRPSAVDHECQLSDHDGEHFHGAALVKTNKGRYFLAANIQTSDDHTDRNCAEKNAIGQSMENCEPGEKVTDIWFTGGLANFSEGCDISPGQEGRRPTPCCVCLGAMYRNNPDMNVHLLPLLEPEKGLALTKHKNGGRDIGTHEYLSLALQDLYKPAHMVISDPAMKRHLSRVMGFLNDPSPVKKSRISKTFGRMSAPKGDSRIEAVNELMMLKLRELYQMPQGNLRHAEIAFVLTDEGKFYGATYFVNDRTPSTPPAVSQAIHNATNEREDARIKEIFYMRVDIEVLNKLSRVANFETYPDIEFLMPDGSALERARKGSIFYNGDEGRFSPEEMRRDIPIHMLMPNVVSLTGKDMQDKGGAAGFDVSKYVQTVYLGDVVCLPWRGSKLVKSGNGAHCEQHGVSLEADS